MTTTTTDDSIRDSGAGMLTAMRALAVGPVMSIADALNTTEAQAQLLRDRLPLRADQLGVADLISLVPGILVEHIDDLPVPGTSFWADGRWHIHIRASKPVDFQVFTAMHQLKHIIDHPLRRQPNSLSDAEWEALANHFARHVLVIESVRFTTLHEGGAPHE
jgi:hypothetical protein